MKKNSLGVKKKKVWSWFAVAGLCVVFLTGILLFFGNNFLSSAEVKKQIQRAVADSTGGVLEYGSIGINLFPTPTIELQTLHYFIPDTVDGKVGILHFTPQFTSLLSGNLKIAQLILESPVVLLNILENKNINSTQKAIAVAKPKIDLSGFLISVRNFVPSVNLKISKGNFTVTQGDSQLEAAGVNSQVSFSIDKSLTGDAHITTDISEIRVKYGETKDSFKNLKFDSKFKVKDEQLEINLKQLSLASPALELNGKAVMTTAVEDISLSLNGAGIDVDATRKLALNFEGKNEVVEAIFRYLIGGNIAKINYSAKAKNPLDLGDWDKFSIHGSLQDGTISIPEIEINLTEVNGGVSIVDGLLSATDVTTRLEGSAGRSGMLKIGLAEDNDLFQLELLLKANLSEAQTILTRIVENPTFREEILKVTKLEGTGTGKLILGESLSNIRARFEDSEMDLSFEYQRVPYPIVIKNGHAAFTENRIDLQNMTGTIGKSAFTNLNCLINWQDGFDLELKTGKSSLVLNELYPWLRGLSKSQNISNEFKNISGGLNLTSVQFKGLLDKPTKWQYSAVGVIDGVTIETTYYPSDIKVENGNFHLEKNKIQLGKSTVKAGDAELIVDGTISHFSGKTGPKVSAVIDGTLGEKSVSWLEGILKFPKSYQLKAPLVLSKNHVSWQVGGPTLLVGDISIANGPRIGLDMNYSPEKIIVKNLTVKDNLSDSTITLVLGKDGLGGSFKGLLDAQSIENIFVKSSLGDGEIAGTVSIKLPDPNQLQGVANGNLKGTNLEIPLSVDDSVKIKDISLKGEGADIGIDINELSWQDFTFAPVTGVATFNKENVVIKVDKAELCGVNAPGTITVAGDDYILDFDLNGKELDVATSYYCLTDGRVKITGKMEFTSQISATGKKGDLLTTLKGPLHMTFSDGVIEQATGISRLLEVLNVTSLVKGKLPDLTTTGFKYTTLSVDGHFAEGKFIIEKLYMDGDTLDVLGQGEVDIAKETLNVELLASPFPNVDSLIKHIPGLNYMMGDRLVAIPVSVKGAMTDPQVSVMSPSSVSKSLMSFGERTIKMPFKLIEAIIPAGAEDKK